MLYFLHIPKTAGISLKSILAEYFPLSEVLDFQFQPEVLHLSPLALRKYKLVMGHLTTGFMEYVGAPYEVVTFLRRPIDQAISWFFDLKENGRIDRNMSLRDLLNSTEVETLINVQSRWLACEDLPGRSLGYDPYYKSRREAIEALTDPRLYEKAAERLQSARFVGITEHFAESVDMLCDDMAWPRTSRVVHYNARSKNLKDVDPESLRRLGELLEPDNRLYQLGLRIFEEQRERNRRSSSGAYQRALGAMPRLSEVHVGCDDAVRGTGWHERELSPGGSWARWSGPTIRSTVELPLTRGHDMTISFLVEAVITETGMEDLRVLVNGVEIHLSREFLKPGTYESVLFYGTIPAGVLERHADHATIEFLAREVRQPFVNDPAATDTRWLGIKVNWLCLTTILTGERRLSKSHASARILSAASRD